MFDDQMVFGFAEEPIEEINQPSAPIDYPDPNVIRETDCHFIKMIKSRFYYQNGNLIWRQGLRKGLKAGYKMADGYNQVELKNKKFMIHILIWKMFFGNYDSNKYVIDHKNGKEDGDCIENLRLATKSQNAMNIKRKRGEMHGIHWDKKSRKWRATIKKDGIKYVKFFHKKENAIAWRKMMEQKLHKEYLAR